MPNPTSGNGVVGIDNIAPIYNPDRRWQVWNMNEIYLGTIANNKYVPKIHDVVFEIVGNIITKYIVLDIDPNTLIPSFIEENNTPHSVNLSTDDILLGVGPGTQSDTYRVYVDKSVTPFRMAVDVRLMVAGTRCRWAKIFKGSTVSESGTVISRMYDNNGFLLSENVPLELAANTLLDNKAIKVVSPCYTNIDLQDGEVVTAVFYDDAGYVVSKRQLLVENTAFIRSPDASMKYIVSINLKSPFLSQTNNTLIQYPINVPLNGLNLIGVVSYSNGDIIEYPVDGTKFTMYGFEQYTATQVGQKINIVLKYSLGPNESNYIAVSGSDVHISKNYEAVTMNADGSYNVKLFAYPVWIDAVSGYSLEWFMYNLDRNIKYNVTPFVVINSTLSLFNPILYGSVQRLNVSINIRNVNGIYKNYTHTQTIDIVLAKQGTERLNNWFVGFSPDQTPKYGVNTYATAEFISTNNWKVKVNCGLTQRSQWLELLYTRSQPLYDSSTEMDPPEPNFFAVVSGGTRTEYSINNWNDDLVINGIINNNSTIFVQFFRRTSTNDLQLAIAGLPVYHVTSTGSYV